ncbi:MAG: divalent metal cation transporter [Chitinophagaceae bacterium]|nr:divalent metal cation transporter [Chitinophagaceae bacterium]
MKSNLSKSRWNNAGLGAAFLMATSAIGPGFLTQTTVFTQQLLSSFGFVIFITILLDIGAQMNIWRILVVSEKRAQDLSNQLVPGLGYFLAILIVLGGLAFNIGNIGGAGLGLNVVSGMDVTSGAILSCVFSLLVFWLKDAGKAIDTISKLLGGLMILLTLYVAFSSHPPIRDAVQHTLLPATISTNAIITIVGGTVGGYISFAGAHRLLDAGVTGPQNIEAVTRSSVTGIIITAFMRVALFIAALGVITGGAIIDPANPPASVFSAAAGQLGYRFFGVVMWCASITSVIGSAYTSVSFLRSFHPWIEKNYRLLISIFIVFSTLVFISIGKPVKVLVTVGALNGLILPIALSVILIAVTKKRLVHNYKHPLWMSIAGWLVVIIMAWLGFKTIVEMFG